MAILDDIRNFLGGKKVVSPVPQTQQPSFGQNLLRQVGNVAPPVAAYNSLQENIPKVQNAISNFATNHPTLANFALKAEPIYNTVQNAVRSIPEKPLNLQLFRDQVSNNGIKTGNDIFNKVANAPMNIAANVGTGIVEGIVNAPTQMVYNAYRFPQAKTLPQALGNTAGIVEPLFSMATPKQIPKLLDEATTQPEFLTQGRKLIAAIKEGLSSGAQFGGTFGALQGMQQNADAATVPEQILKSVPSTITGAAAGGVIGAGTAGAGQVIRSSVEAIQGQARTQAKDMADRLLRQAQNKRPKWAKGKSPQEIEDYLYDYYKRTIGQGGFVDVSGGTDQSGLLQRDKKALGIEGEFPESRLAIEQPQVTKPIKQSEVSPSNLTRSGEMPQLNTQLGTELEKSLKGFEDRTGALQMGIINQAKGVLPESTQEIRQPMQDTSSSGINILNVGTEQTTQPRQLLTQMQGLLNQPLQTSIPSQKSQSRSLDDILQQAKSEIQKQPDKKQSIKGAWDKFYTDYVNRMQPVEDLTKSVEKKLNISIRPEFSPKYQIMKLLGAGGTAELRHRKELDPIIKELGNVDKADFDVFLKASRDVELGARGIKGSDTQLAQQRIQALGTKYDLNQFKNVAIKLYDYQDRGLQKLVQAGFINETTYKTIKGQNEAYVPFQRVMDEVDNYLGLPTKKLSQGKQPISTIKGSDRAILSPLESIIANTYKLEGAVAKNNVAKSIANLHKIDSEVGITPLRIAENVKKRIDIYTELKELGGNKNKLDRLFSTRNRWSRKIQSELNRLNKEGIEIYLKRKPDPEIPQASSAIQEKQYFERPNIVTDTGDTFRGPAVVTGTGIKDVYVQPTDKEVKQLVNDLVNSPPETIRAIKSKIATRENKLGTVLDELESLRTNIDSIKSKRSELFDEAKLIQDAKTKGKDVISVWNNGIKELYEVPQDVNDVVKGLNEEQVGQVVKLMSIPANILRQGATGRNVDFMIPNIVKDQFDAAVSSKYGYRPFIDYFNGLGEMIKAGMGKPNLYDEYAKSGGKIFYEMAGGRKAIAREIQDATVQKNLGRKFFSSLTDGLDFLGKMSETPTRVGLFKKALQGSGNKLIAASEAREGTLDFARMGAKMKTANSIIPFLNVGVQGFDKLIRNAKDNPGKMLFYGTLYGIAPQIALTVWNNTNHPQEYQEIPDDIKQDNFVLVTGRTPEGRVKYATLSKGNIMPYITNPVDNLLSAAAGYDRQSFKTLATQLLGDMLPLIEPGRDMEQTASRSLGSVIPQAIKPAIENVANYNFYKGKEIVPSYLKNKSPVDQSYETTELPYKYIGNLIQVSPLKVKNVLEGYLSGFVKTPLQIASILQKVSRGEQPSSNEIPVLRRFISETYDTGEQYQEKQQKLQDVTASEQDVKSQIPPLEKRLFGEVSAAEYEASKEAPKNIPEKILLAARGIGVDPQNTIKAIFTEERMRKISGNALILERQVKLNKTKDRTDAVDHIIPLSLGGTNEPSNLRYISKEANSEKAKLETRLAKELAQGKITKEEARQQVQDWVSTYEPNGPLTQPTSGSVPDLLTKKSQESKALKEYKQYALGKKKLEKPDEYFSKYGTTTEQLNQRVIKSLNTQDQAVQVYDLMKSEKFSQAKFTEFVNQGLLTDAIAKEFYDTGKVNKGQYDALRIAIKEAKTGKPATKKTNGGKKVSKAELKSLYTKVNKPITYKKPSTRVSPVKLLEARRLPTLTFKGKPLTFKKKKLSL